MFEYFEDNYPWNLAIVTALGMGAVASDIDTVCRPLRALGSAAPEVSSPAWAGAWSSLAARLERQARRDEANQHQRSAGDKYLRGALYALMGERALPTRDAQKLAVYKDGLRMFARGAALCGDAAEFVAIPYRGKSLPAIFVKAGTAGPAPCMIQFNGFDWIKEFNYLLAAREYAARGVSSLFCDQPGSGGALRLEQITMDPESEHAATACVDFLEQRRDVDAARIGIQAASLGGYYAPRAAAFEKRLACCVVQGAFFDAGEVAAMRLQQGASYARSVPDVDDQVMWVTGQDSVPAALQFLRRVTLKHVLQEITCPLLVVHGGADRQIPIDHGQKTYDGAVNSSDRRLVVLGPEEGGVEHCSIDNIPLVRDLMANFICDVFRI